jgi:hypothetical protein
MRIEDVAVGSCMSAREEDERKFLERSCRLLSEIPAGVPGNQLQASTAHSSGGERKERVDAEVPPNEGNEVRRDARQEVVAL